MRRNSLVLALLLRLPSFFTMALQLPSFFAFGRRQGSSSALVDDANTTASPPLPCASVLDSSFMLKTTKFLPEIKRGGSSAAHIDPDAVAWRKVRSLAPCLNELK